MRITCKYIYFTIYFGLDFEFDPTLSDLNWFILHLSSPEYGHAGILTYMCKCSPLCNLINEGSALWETLISQYNTTFCIKEIFYIVIYYEQWLPHCSLWQQEHMFTKDRALIKSKFKPSITDFSWPLGGSENKFRTQHWHIISWQTVAYLQGVGENWL